VDLHDSSCPIRAQRESERLMDVAPGIIPERQFRAHGIASRKTGSRFGGVGVGVSPKTGLSVGHKAYVDTLRRSAGSEGLTLFESVGLKTQQH
jgi:hypothetical protein